MNGVNWNVDDEPIIKSGEAQDVDRQLIDLVVLPLVDSSQARFQGRTSPLSTGSLIFVRGSSFLI